MALPLERPEVERLIEEVTRLTGETGPEAIRRALEERRERLTSGATAAELRHTAALRWLREEVWPTIPPELRGRGIPREEQEEILGYGPGGV